MKSIYSEALKSILIAAATGCILTIVKVLARIENNYIFGVIYFLIASIITKAISIRTWSTPVSIFPSLLVLGLFGGYAIHPVYGLFIVGQGLQAWGITTESKHIYDKSIFERKYGARIAKVGLIWTLICVAYFIYHLVVTFVI